MTFTSTPFRPGVGTGTSSSRSGWPKACTTAAFMVFIGILNMSHDSVYGLCEYIPIWMLVDDQHAFNEQRHEAIIESTQNTPPCA
jgi:hypothetical protein